MSRTIGIAAAMKCINVHVNVPTLHTLPHNHPQFSDTDLSHWKFHIATAWYIFLQSHILCCTVFDCFEILFPDVETFLVETLKSVKLNSSAKDSKDRLLEKVRQLLEEITGSSSGQLDSSASGGSHKISGGEGETLKTKFCL